MCSSTVTDTDADADADADADVQMQGILAEATVSHDLYFQI